jgi:hypothetical protein
MSRAREDPAQTPRIWSLVQTPLSSDKFVVLGSLSVHPIA